MAELGDKVAGPAGGRGHLRASHADRERVIGTLKAAFVLGMLAKDEFDLRVGQTLSSRTYADLAALTADLPAGVAAAKSAQLGPVQGGQPVVRPGRVIEVSTGIYAGAWAGAAFLAPNGGEAPWSSPLLFEGFVVYLGVLIICVAAILARRRDGRSAGQPPRQLSAPRRDSTGRL